MQKKLHIRSPPVYYATSTTIKKDDFGDAFFFLHAFKHRNQNGRLAFVQIAL